MFKMLFYLFMLPLYIMYYVFKYMIIFVIVICNTLLKYFRASKKLSKPVSYVENNYKEETVPSTIDFAEISTSNIKKEENQNNHYNKLVRYNHEEKKHNDINLITYKENINVPCECEKIYQMPNIIINSFEEEYSFKLTNEILINTPPEFLKVLIIDTRKLNFLNFENVSYLLTPIVNDIDKVLICLKRIIAEVESRYEFLLIHGSKSIEQYNHKEGKQFLSNIIIVINDLYDVIIDNEIKELFMNIILKGKKVGITVLAFTSVEKKYLKLELVKNLVLLTSQKEFEKKKEEILWKVSNIYLINTKPDYLLNDFEELKVISPIAMEDDEEPLYNDIVEFVATHGKASASLLQRRFRLGYNRAARCIDLLEERGIIGPANGLRPREVLVKFENDDE